MATRMTADALYGISELASSALSVGFERATWQALEPRITWRGVQSGDLVSVPATRRSIELPDINMFRVKGGRVVEQWAELDIFRLLQQIGAIRHLVRRAGRRVHHRIVQPGTNPSVVPDGVNRGPQSREAFDVALRRGRADKRMQHHKTFECECHVHDALGQPPNQSGRGSRMMTWVTRDLKAA